MLVGRHPPPMSSDKESKHKGSKQQVARGRYRNAETQMAILGALCSHNRGLTVKEVMDVLQEQGIATSDERNTQIIMKHLADVYKNISVTRDGRAFRYSWTGKRLPWMPGMDDRERLLMMLAKRHLLDILPMAVRELIEGKLESWPQGDPTSPFGNQLQGWKDKVETISLLPKFIAPEIDADVLTHVSNALLRDHWLHINYTNSAGRELLNKRVMPLALVQQTERLYLVCRFHMRQDIRHLALHRLTHAQDTNLKFERPTFSLTDYINGGAFGFGNGECVTLTLQVQPHLAHLLKETPLSKGQLLEELADGTFLVTASVIRGEQIRWWIRMHGSAIEVVEPKGLLDEVDSTLPAKTPT